MSIKILLDPGVEFTSVAIKSSPNVSHPGQRLSSPALLSFICTLKVWRTKLFFYEGTDYKRTELGVAFSP